MTGWTELPIFDGHNDSLLRVWRAGEDGVGAFLQGGCYGHLDLPRALEGGMRGGLFAVFVPRPPGEPALPEQSRAEKELAPALPHEWALQVAREQTAILKRLEADSGGRVKLALGTADVRDAAESGALACLLHFEGAEPLSEDLTNLEEWYETGLRSVGLVWARPNAFAVGVPLRFPSSPDTGPGLTAAGKELVRQCRSLGIVVDVSHLNYRGFLDVAREYGGPVVATHSDAHALCPAARNLTDEQLRMIRDSGGLAGVSLNVADMNDDGGESTALTIETVARHVEHFAQVAGLAHAAIGSDFDGCSVPDAIGDARGLGRIAEALSDRGWTRGEIKRVCWDNWMRVLDTIQRRS